MRCFLKHEAPETREMTMALGSPVPDFLALLKHLLQHIAVPTLVRIHSAIVLAPKVW